KSTGAAEMSTSTIEAVGRAWASIAEEPEIHPDNHRTATTQAHRALSLIKIKQPTTPHKSYGIASFGL
ncbi:hypothetical protein, partial [Enterobacter asburiae]